MKNDEITLLKKIPLRIRYELREKHKDEILICIPVKDENLEKAYVSVQSIQKVCPNRKVKVWIVSDDSKLNINVNTLNLADNVKISVLSYARWLKKIQYYYKWIYMLPGCIACCDLTEIFNISFRDDESFAAALYLKNNIYYKYILNRSGVNPESYVDTSVLLVNEIVMEWYRDEIHAEIEQCMDNDKALELALNRICKDHIHILDQKWNCSWQPVFADSRNEFLLYDDMLRYKIGMECPGIINYNGLYTPECYPVRKESCYYWKNVRELPFYCKYISNISKKAGIDADNLKRQIEEIIQECEKK